LKSWSVHWGKNSLHKIAKFRLKASLKDLGKIRQFIKQEAESRHVNSTAIYDLNLAVTELVTNTLNYGYQNRPGIIEIELFKEDGDLLIRLRDEAPAFDPTQMKKPDLSLHLYERPLGKMGIYLARGSVDRFAHRRIPEGGNEITLEKKGAFAD
jgi:serine/threonine-protein kinase RsbW